MASLVLTAKSVLDPQQPVALNQADASDYKRCGTDHSLARNGGAPLRTGPVKSDLGVASDRRQTVNLLTWSGGHGGSAGSCQVDVLIHDVSCLHLTEVGWPSSLSLAHQRGLFWRPTAMARLNCFPRMGFAQFSL